MKQIITLHYQVTFDGDKAAKQIPLTYKANGTNEQKVTLDKGLNFTNGKNYNSFCRCYLNQQDGLTITGGTSSLRKMEYRC